MFCPKCRGEYRGWKRCPQCKLPLIAEQRPDFSHAREEIGYAELVERLREQNGVIETVVYATDVVTEKKLGFPYSGFGYAWACRMQGAIDYLLVDLQAGEVGREREVRFPYMGYGYAWAQRLDGTVGGNHLAMEARRVNKERKWRFPYKGYGRAWAEAFAGTCGDQIAAELVISDVGRSSSWRFPYFAYGFAWENRGVLTLRLG